MAVKQKQSEEFRQRRQRALRTTWGLVILALVSFCLLLFLPVPFFPEILVTPICAIVGIIKWQKYKKNEANLITVPPPSSNASKSPLVNTLLEGSSRVHPTAFRIAGDLVQTPQGQSFVHARTHADQFVELICQRRPPHYNLFQHDNTQGKTKDTDYVIDTDGIEIKIAKAHSLYAWVRIEGNLYSFRWMVMAAEKHALLYKGRNSSHFTIEPDDKRVREWSTGYLVVAKFWDFLADTFSSKYENDFGTKDRYSLDVIHEARDLSLFIQDAWFEAVESSMGAKTTFPERDLASDQVKPQSKIWD